MRRPVSTALRPSRCISNGSATYAAICAKNEHRPVASESENIGCAADRTESAAPCDRARGAPAPRRTRSPPASCTTAASFASSCASDCRPEISSAKGRDMQDHARVVERPVRALGVRQREGRDARRDQADRHVHHEQPAPVSDSEHSRADCGPDCRAEVATTRALMPTARPSWLDGYVKRTSAAFTLIIPAAPSPCTARATVSSTSECANAHASDATVKRMRPA